MGTVEGFTALRQKQVPSHEDCSDSQNCCRSSERKVGDKKEADKEIGNMLKETIHFSGVRREEREVDIPPGERLSIVVACQAK